MEQEVALFLASEMLKVSAKIAAPLLITSLVVGLLISIVQVATQIQEMTLTFVPKIIAAVIVVLTTSGWMLNSLVEFTRQVFTFASVV